MDEVWKDVVGYEELYQISNLGRIKSFKESLDGKVLKQTKDKDGYFKIGIRDKFFKRKYFRVHRLVAEAFIPNPNNYDYVNHKDNNPANNIVSNLEWCTLAYNNKYRFTHGGYSHKGEKSTTAILTNEQVLEIYDLCWHSEKSQSEIARMFGVSRGAISGIKYGDSWSHITGHIKNKEE